MPHAQAQALKLYYWPHIQIETADQGVFVRTLHATGYTLESAVVVVMTVVAEHFTLANSEQFKRRLMDAHSHIVVSGHAAFITS